MFGRWRENWILRRRTIYGALIYIGAHMSFILIRGADTALNQQAFIALCGAGTAIIGSWVFGAAWDDDSKRRHSREGEGQ